MGNFYKIVMYLLMILCGGCAVMEVMMGRGSGFGLTCVMAGLILILYIVKLPVELEKND